MNRKEHKALLFDAASIGTLKDLDPKLITLETMAWRDQYSVTVLHYAAYNDNLDQIDPSIISLDTLAWRDQNEVTVLHRASENGYLKKINPDFITIETLAWEDNIKGTVLHSLAAGIGHLKQTDPSFITTETLAWENKYGESVLSIALNHPKQLLPYLKKSNLSVIELTQKEGILQKFFENGKQKELLEILTQSNHPSLNSQNPTLINALGDREGVDDFLLDLLERENQQVQKVRESITPSIQKQKGVRI